MNKRLAEIKQYAHHWLGKLVIALILIAVVIICIRIYESFLLRRETLDQSITTVQVIIVKDNKVKEELMLPGNIQAWHESTIYARTNGYVKKWYVDIGAHVKADQLLAEIETPEINAQLRQAEADLKTATANSALAQSTANRWLNLLKSSSVSKQETDEKVSAAKALAATEISARANRDRLQELVGFSRVVAPFDGIITARTTDIGALINAGSSTSGVPLFQIAQINPLRLYVNIPQAYVSRITPHMTVTLYVPEFPNQPFTATLVDTARVIAPNTRTLLAQFEADNSQGKLLAGSYAQVHFSFQLPKNTIFLPINSLLFRKEGLQVALVDKDNKVFLKSISITRDLGNEVEITSGLQVGDKIIINPPDSISTGEQVRVKS